MAALRLRVYEPPGAELEALSDPTPRWVERLFESYGASAGSPVPSAQLEALGEELGRRLLSLALIARKAEQRGWTVQLAGNDIVITSGLAPAATRAALEDDGVWHLAQQLTPE